MLLLVGCEEVCIRHLLHSELAHLTLPLMHALCCIHAACSWLALLAQVKSIVDLLREGRCALHTRLACYKFLITYGLHFSVLNLVCTWYASLLPQGTPYLCVYTQQSHIA